MPEQRVPIGRNGVLTRRTVIAGAAAAIGGIWLTSNLAGCASAPGTALTQLSFWHLLTGGDGIRMSDLVDRANANNPDFAAEQTVLTWGPPYYTKLAMASAGGRAPDVAIMHASRLPGYAPGGLLDPWDQDVLAELGVAESNFPPVVWEKGFSGDQLYSIALDVHPFVLMYNTDFADEAGALDDEGHLVEITSPDQFLEVARAIQQVTGGFGLSYGYLNDGAQLFRLWYTFYLQQGATMELPVGGEAEIDQDAAVASFEFMQQLLDDEIATSRGDYATAVAEFTGGETGLFFSGVWEVPTAKAAELPFDVMPIPTLFGTPAAYADSHAFVLPHQDAPNETKRRDTYRFVTDILKGSFEWAGAGHVPAFLPVTETAEYADLRPQANYVQVRDIVNYDPAAWFTGSGSDFQNLFSENLQGVLLNGDDPAAGMRRFTDRLNVLLSRPNPV